MLKSEECFVMRILSIKVEECLPEWQGMNTPEVGWDTIVVKHILIEICANFQQAFLVLFSTLHQCSTVTI